MFQAGDTCHMPGFCASIVLAFISGVGLCDSVLDAGTLWEPDWGRKANGGYGLTMGKGESNSQDAMRMYKQMRMYKPC